MSPSFVNGQIRVWVVVSPLLRHVFPIQKPKVGTFWQAHRPLIFQQIFKSFHLFSSAALDVLHVVDGKNMCSPFFSRAKFLVNECIEFLVSQTEPKMGSSSWVPMAATTVISGVSTVTVIPDNPGNYPLKSPGIYPITRHIPNKTSLCLTSSRFSICGYPGYLIFAVSSIFLAARSAAW